MQNEKQKAGVSLWVTLAAQDAEMLRAALPAATVLRDELGIKDTRSLACVALGAIARTLLRESYQPQPLAAEMRPEGITDRGPLPPGVIIVQLA